MPRNLRWFYASLIAILLMIPLVTIANLSAGSADIWWTPLPLALSVATARDRVEIYVRGERLDAVLNQKRLSLSDPTGLRAVEPEEVRLRFNNWDRIRAGRLPLLLACAAS